MYWAPDIAEAALTAVLVTVLPASAIILTPKCSIIRYFTIVCAAMLTLRFMHPVIGSSTIRSTASAQLVLTTVQAMNVLTLNPIDQKDIAHENPKTAHSCLNLLYYASEAVVFLRAVNTPRQIKNIPVFPSYYAIRLRAGVIPRSTFLYRQILIFIWQYLALDLLQTTARLNAPSQKAATSVIEFAHLNYRVSCEKWIERVLISLINWFLSSRIIIDANYRFMSILFVGLGFDAPENWPPLFGRMVDVYTVRNFWGFTLTCRPLGLSYPALFIDTDHSDAHRKFWHQLLRGPFTAVSNFITRGILQLPRPSVLERYTNIFLVFGISGLLHVLVDRVQGIPSEYSGAMIVFPITAFAIMLEDGVQELCARLTQSAIASRTQVTMKIPIWYRAVGYFWTMTWLGVVSSWYFQPFFQLPPELTTLVPLNLVENLGLAPIGVAVSIIGLLLAYFWGPEF